MDYVRLGLGNEVESLGTAVDAGGGAVSLTLKRRYSDRFVRGSALSDGTLAYLGVVAMLRLPSRRSVLAIDEPELHLHPHALTRVVQLLEEVSMTCPVVLATHSDRLLDALTRPAESVVSCELGSDGATQLLRPDPPALDRWVGKYRGGFGVLRSEGVADVVLRETPERAE